MKDICGEITCRGKICQTPKTKCIFHGLDNQKEFKNDIILFNSQGQRICGVKTTGHTQNERPCKQLVNGDSFCVYHRKKFIEEKEIAEIRNSFLILFFNKFYFSINFNLISS